MHRVGIDRSHLAARRDAMSERISPADLVRYNKDTARGRLWLLGIVFIGLGLAEQIVPGGSDSLGISLRALVLPTLAGVALSVVILYGSALDRRPRLGLYLQLLVSLSIVTLGIHVASSGETAMACRLLYVLIILPPHLISRRAAGVALAASIASHLLLIGADHGFTVASYGSGAAIAPVFGFVLIAMMASLYGGYMGESARELRALASHLESSRRRLAGLVELAKMLNSSSEMETVVETVNWTARREFRADWCATYRIDSRRGVFGIAAASSSVDRTAPGQCIEDWPVLDQVNRDGVIFPSREVIENLAGPLQIPDHFSTVALAALSRGDELQGFLALGYTGERPCFSDAELSQVAAVAEHATLALHNARLLEEAREASALKSEFLSTVSHELRTPLNVIIGYAEILLDEEVGPLNSEQRDLFRRVDIQARDLNELIESVLQVGRIENGRDAIINSVVDMDTLCFAIEAAVENLPRHEGVVLRWDGRKQVRGSLETDAAKVGLVVRNLVGNALKFTVSGEIRIAFERNGDHLVVTVSDTGPGIVPTSLPGIFEMFRQAERSPDAPREKGVGLGLYIVDQTVRRLGGTVRVDSTLGKGTTFRVSLPGFVDDSLVGVDASSFAEASEDRSRPGRTKAA